MKITRVGLDIAKRVFQVHGVDEQGRTRVRKKLSRSQVLEFFVQLPPCLVASRRAVGRTIGRANSASLGTR